MKCPTVATYPELSMMANLDLASCQMSSSVSELIRQVVSQNASAAIDQAEYNRKYDSLAERFHKAADRVKEIDAECARRKGQRREIETFRDAVLANDQPVTVFSTEFWNATIDRMTVNLDGSVKVAFRKGIEMTV